MAAVLAFAIALVASQAGRADASVAGQSKTPIPANSGWKRFVIDPGKLVYPKAAYVVGTSPSNVRDTRGLKAPGGGAMTIDETGLNASGVGQPAVLLDLGENVGGYVEIGVRSSSGTPVRLGYSESLDHLTPRGDTGGPQFSFGTSDDPDARTDVFQTTRPAQFRSAGIRGAQRFISLQLDGPGTATIDYVRVTDRAPPSGAGRLQRLLPLERRCAQPDLVRERVHVRDGLLPGPALRVQPDHRLGWGEAGSRHLGG